MAQPRPLGPPRRFKRRAHEEGEQSALERDEGDETTEAALELSATEQEEVERRASLRVVVVHEAIRKEGEDELSRPVSALAWSGLAAGLSMGFSLVTEGLFRSSLVRQEDAAVVRLDADLHEGAPHLVVEHARVCDDGGEDQGADQVRRQHHRPEPRHLEQRVPVPAREERQDDGERVLGEQLLRGIFAGWLIALMVWLLPSAGSNRMAVIVAVTYVVGHCWPSSATRSASSSSSSAVSSVDAAGSVDYC